MIFNFIVGLAVIVLFVRCMMYKGEVGTKDTIIDSLMNTCTRWENKYYKASGDYNKLRKDGEILQNQVTYYKMLWKTERKEKEQLIAEYEERMANPEIIVTKLDGKLEVDVYV